jgi:hypothetical protein
VNLRFELPPEAVDAIVDRVTERVLAELAANDRFPAQGTRSPYLSVDEAADYLRCSRQRIDDLLSQRRPAGEGRFPRSRSTQGHRGTPGYRGQATVSWEGGSYGDHRYSRGPVRLHPGDYVRSSCETAPVSFRADFPSAENPRGNPV